MARDRGNGSVYQDPRGHWIASVEAGWTRNGTRRRRRRTAPTKRDALILLRQMLREDPGEATATVTVKTYAEGWLVTAERRLRPSSLGVTKAAVAWIVQTIGHRRLDRLTPADIRALDRAVLDSGLAPSTALRYRGVLHKLLADAVQDGHQVPPRVREVAKPPAGEGERREISLPDATRILAVATQRPDASRWAAALLQGMRPAECLGLTWDCVDLAEGVIDVSWQLQPLPYVRPRDRTSGYRVPVAYASRHLVDAYHLVRPKTGKGQRLIPLTPWMADALASWREVAPSSPYGLVWSAAGRPITAQADRAAWRSLCEAAGVGPYDLYSCRHTTATLLREAGVASEVIVAIMGHSSILSTRSYLHVDKGQLRQALGKVAERLELGC